MATATADVHFFSPEGCDVFIDVRRMNLPPEGTIGVRVLSVNAGSLAVRSEHGHRHHGLKPFVLEAAGTARPVASLILAWLMRRLQLQQGYSQLAASQKASTELIDPLSCAPVRSAVGSQLLSRRGLPPPHKGGTQPLATHCPLSLHATTAGV